MKEHMNRPFDKEVLAVLGIILVAFVAFVSFWMGGTVVSLKLEKQSANAGVPMDGCVRLISGVTVYLACPVGTVPLPPALAN